MFIGYGAKRLRSGAWGSDYLLLGWRMAVRWINGRLFKVSEILYLIVLTLYIL